LDSYDSDNYHKSEAVKVQEQIKAEVITDPQVMLRSGIELFSQVEFSLDICGDEKAPPMYFELKPLWLAFTQVKDRGVKIRFVTEITNNNLSYCYELMKVCQLKHLDGINFGGFGIADRREYRASTVSNSTMGGIPPNYIICSISTMVEQQQRLFDLLWQKAIPAKQRLKEIEEGLKREFLETIQDPHEIKNLIPKVISSANEEILLLFSTVNTFKRYYAEGFLDLLVDKIRDRKNSELKVRILINSEIERTQLKETVSNISSGLNNLEVLQSKSTKYDTKVTFILVDREVSLVIEIKDDTKERILDSVGFATYSNSQSSVLSYTSIFETLWIKAELSQRPHTNNT